VVIISRKNISWQLEPDVKKKKALKLSYLCQKAIFNILGNTASSVPTGIGNIGTTT
jgi:hypothetical protein